MKYYLAKSEPTTYSIEMLERDGTTVWDGVKNAQALQAIRLMADGDCVIFYHSQGISAIVGWGYVEGPVRAEIADPKLAIFTMRFGGRLLVPVSLREVKDTGQFEDFALVRQSRLSTMAVPAPFISWLKKASRSFKP